MQTIYFLDWQPQSDNTFAAVQPLTFATSPETITINLTGNYGLYQLQAASLEISVTGGNAIQATIDGVTTIWYPGAFVAQNLTRNSRSITLVGYAPDAVTITFYDHQRPERVISSYRPNLIAKDVNYNLWENLNVTVNIGTPATPYYWPVTNPAPFNTGLAATNLIQVFNPQALRYVLSFGGDMQMPVSAGSGKFRIAYSFNGVGINILSPGVMFHNSPLVLSGVWLALVYQLGIDPAPGVNLTYNAGYLMAEEWLA